MERNEIFFRELLRLGRSGKVYTLRSIAPLAIGALLLALFVADDPQAGIHSFVWLTVVFNLFSFVAIALLISGILHEEWQSNTLSVLFLAETSLGAVLRGILGSRVLLVLANLFACFPLLLSVMSFGGVNGEQMLQFSTLMVSLTIFYGAFALWGTCLIPRRESSLCFIFACVGLPQIIGLYAYNFVSGGLPRWTAWIPSVALSRLTEDVLPWTRFGGEPVSTGEAGNATSWSLAGDWLSLNVLFVSFAAFFLVLARGRLGARLRVPVAERVRASGRTEPSSFKPIVGNPLSWLVLKRFDPLFRIPKIVALGGAVTLSVGFEVVDSQLQNSVVRHAIGLLGLVIMGWTCLWACLVSAQMWMEERTERTLELLLATPFTRDEVILWKVDALFWALVTPTAMYSLLLPASFWQSQSLADLWVRLFLLVPALLCCFLYSYVALFVIVYLTIYFAIAANSAVQAVLSTLGLVGSVLLVNVLGFVYGINTGLFFLVLVADIALLCTFIPLFRKRIRAFELR